MEFVSNCCLPFIFRIILTFQNAFRSQNIGYINSVFLLRKVSPLIFLLIYIKNKLGLSSAKLSRTKFGCIEVMIEVVSKDNMN